MLVYRYYRAFADRDLAFEYGMSHPDAKLGGHFHIGFYKERGGYVHCLGLGPRRWMVYEYAGGWDVVELIEVERNIEFAAGKMDLMCWRIKETGHLVWAIADYLGFAVHIGPNIYVIKP